MWFDEVLLARKAEAAGGDASTSDKELRTRVESAQKRYAKAKADGRLVFVLHLSGNIEDPGFT